MVARPVLWGVAAFGLTAATCGAAAGTLAASARPAGSTGPRTAPSSAPSGSTLAARLSESSGGAWTDLTFLHSMVLSGAAALVLSVAGMVVVLRRRRYW